VVKTVIVIGCFMKQVIILAGR